MFSSLIDLTGFSSESETFDYLYLFFEQDFVSQQTFLAGSIYLDPKGQGMRDGREEVFWHITTREKRKKVKQGKKIVEIVTRPLDPDRSARLEWIRPMMMNHSHADIRLFYRKETKGKKPIRLYLWAYQHDFVVIVQKLGAKDAFLVTCFYITEPYKRASYAKWHTEYLSGLRPELAGCEWF